jgi:hypothetical protein
MAYGASRKSVHEAIKRSPYLSEATLIQILRPIPLPKKQLQRLLRQYRGVAIVSFESDELSKYIEAELNIGEMFHITVDPHNKDMPAQIVRQYLNIFTYL